MAANFTSPDEFTLLDYTAIVRRRWPWVVLPAALLMLLATAYTLNQPDRFEATARVLLADSAAQRTLDPSSQNTGFLTRELSNEISLARSDQVESLIVAERGSLPEVDISADSTADVLVFQATAGSDTDAADDANLWADKYVEVKRDEAVTNITAATTSLQSRLEQLRLERQQLRAPLDELDERIAGAPDAEAAAELQRDYDRLAGDLSYELALVTGQAEATVASLNELQLQAELSAVGEARIVQVAAPPEQPGNAPLSRNLPLALIVGLMLGVALALLSDNRDNTIKSGADVQAMTDLPLLAVIPKADTKRNTKIELASLMEPESVFADGYHKLRSALEFLAFEQDVSSIMVTSASASEGKSTTSANLALALASVGKRTLLVDLDFRRARVHEIFDIEQRPGLTDFVLAGATAESISRHVGAADSKLWAVPTGTTPPNPASFVGTPGFLNTIDWLAEEADVAVFDAPPLLAVSEAHTLGKHVDVVVLTAMAGKTTRSDLLEVISQLRQVGANLAGIVLVGVAEQDSYGRHREYYSAAESWPTAGTFDSGQGSILTTTPRPAAAPAMPQQATPQHNGSGAGADLINLTEPVNGIGLHPDGAQTNGHTEAIPIPGGGRTNGADPYGADFNGNGTHANGAVDGSGGLRPPTILELPSTPSSTTLSPPEPPQATPQIDPQSIEWKD